MRDGRDELVPPVEHLKKAVAAESSGNDRAWSQQLSDALAELEEAMRRHVAEAEAPAGIYAEVDLTRPSLVREVGELRREHAVFADQLADLRLQLQRAARGMPERPGTDPASGLSAIRQAVRDFVTALEQHRAHEAGVLIESVTTDLGAGD